MEVFRNKRTLYVLLIAGLLAISIVTYTFLKQQPAQSATSKPSPSYLISSMPADVAYYPSISKLYEEADLVVIGKPIEKLEKRYSHGEKSDDGSLLYFYTKTTFKIDKVIKGSPDMKQTSIIEPYWVRQSDVLPDVLTTNHYTPMQQGSQYIVFLQRLTLKDSYSVFGLQKGKFNLDGTDLSDDYSDLEPAQLSNEIKTLQKEKRAFKKQLKKEVL